MYKLKALFVAASLAATMTVSAATISVTSANIDNGSTTNLVNYGVGASVDYDLGIGAFSADSIFEVTDGPVDAQIEVSFNQQDKFTDGIFTFNGVDYAIEENFVLYAPLLAVNTMDLVGTATAAFTRYTLNVSEVPIPAALLLMAPLLLGAYGLRRKLVAAQV